MQMSKSPIISGYEPEMYYYLNTRTYQT